MTDLRTWANGSAQAAILKALGIDNHAAAAAAIENLRLRARDQLRESVIAAVPLPPPGVDPVSAGDAYRAAVNRLIPRSAPRGSRRGAPRSP